MSTPSSLPCPEPIPSSGDISRYAEIDFATTPPPVFSAQPNMVPVDTILSNQLGPVTNPVTPSSSMDNGILGAPILPVVEESNAKPLLSSYSGSDINASTTLANNNLGFVSVNDISNMSVESSNAPNVPGIQKFTNQVAPETPQNNIPAPPQNNIPTPPQNNIPMPFENNNPLPHHDSSMPHNHNSMPHNNNSMPPRNLSTFIANNDKPRASTEHFNPKPNNKNIAPVKNIEHFMSQMTMMDNIVLAIVVGSIIYYVVSAKHNMDLSKVPILAQLSDPAVTVQNKIIIVIAVVVALVLIGRMLK